jgi:hypothetical protein
MTPGELQLETLFFSFVVLNPSLEANRQVESSHVSVSNEQVSTEGLDDDPHLDQSDIANAQVDMNQKKKAIPRTNPPMKGKKIQYQEQYETPESCSSSTEDSDSQSDIYIPGEDNRDLSFRDSTSTEGIASSEEEQSSYPHSLAAASSKTPTRKDSRPRQKAPTFGRMSRKRPRTRSGSETSGTLESNHPKQSKLAERPPAKLQKKRNDTAAATNQDVEAKRLKYNENIFGLFGTA